MKKYTRQYTYLMHIESIESEVCIVLSTLRSYLKTPMCE